MIILKKRIRNISPYISRIQEGKNIIVGVTDLDRFDVQLKEMGLSEPYVAGQSILPAGSFGTISRFNAEGKDVVHKELPMETAYRQIEWHWDEWDGPYNTVERSKIVDVPYQRYPRTFVEPPAVELTITKNKLGKLFLIGPLLVKQETEKEVLTHLVNLFLEIFGECQFFTENFDDIPKSSLIRLNWEILPQGEMPWDQFRQRLDPLIKQAPAGNQPILIHRLEIINRLEPDFRAVGRGGFHGYIVHGFTNKKLFILESMYYGNATYIFEEKWEEFSKLTKAEILNQSLQKDRVIHRDGWEEKIEKQFS